MALAASSASSLAATVQITLAGNKISSTGGNELKADLTGDSTPDVTLTGQGGAAPEWVGALIDGNYVTARFSFGAFRADPVFAGPGVGSFAQVGPSTRSVSYLNPITFTDQRINSGSPTGGWVQVNAYNTSATNHTVELARLIFDDANTARPSLDAIPGVLTGWPVAAVPEPGSNLALLALGAGGLTLRRRLKRAA
jgi:hypothetical protein